MQMYYLDNNSWTNISVIDELMPLYITKSFYNDNHSKENLFYCKEGFGDTLSIYICIFSLIQEYY